MVPATNASRQASGALLFFMGTPPRPSDPGEEFTNRRLKALGKKHGDQVRVVRGNAVYVEFSADGDADPDDHEQWSKANPSFPSRTPVESMERMRENLTDDDSFRREALGIWDAAGTPEVIDSASWMKIADPASMPVDRLTLAVDVSPDRRVAAVSLSGQRADGLWHVELDQHRQHTDWVAAWVTSRASKNRLHAVVIDELSGLVEDRKGRHYLKGTDVVVTLAASEGRDMAIASGQLYDAVMEPTPRVRHVDQPQMNVSVSVARKRAMRSGGWAWTPNDASSDITPIVSATLALWGAQKDDVERPTRRVASERTALVL